MQFKSVRVSRHWVSGCPQEPGVLCMHVCDHSNSLVCKMTCHKKCVHKIQSYCSYTGRRKVSIPNPGAF